MKKMPVMEGEKQTPLQYDIRFEDVSFQYEQKSKRCDPLMFLSISPKKK